MASYNKIQLTGKLTDAPDVKATTSGHSLAKFTLIVPRIDALPNQRFDMIRITAWRENADKAATFKKNDILYIDGRIITDSYEDSSTGQKKWTTEVEARQLVNFNEVFTDEISHQEKPTLDTLPKITPNEPVENLPIPPVDETLFFNQSSTSDETENELDEAVPF